MNVWIKKLKEWSKRGVYLGLAMIIVSMGLGCASTHKTTTTKTTVTYPNEGVVNEGEQTTTVSTSSDQQNNEVVEKSETTTTTNETKAEHPGIISSTFHAIGYVIALPFIMVGGLIRMLF